MSSSTAMVFRKNMHSFRSWTVWFASIMAISHIVIAAIMNLLNDEVISWSIFYTSSQSSRIFMLVVGIMSMGGFLKYYVDNGVTRKAYYKGTVFSAVLLAVLLSIITAVLFSLETFIIGSFDWYEGFALSALPAELFEHFFELIVFYFAGWFISAGFQYHHFTIGLLYIIIAVIFIHFHHFAWGTDNFDYMPHMDLSIFVSLPASLICITLLAILLKWETRKAPIKP